MWNCGAWGYIFKRLSFPCCVCKPLWVFESQVSIIFDQLKFMALSTSHYNPLDSWSEEHAILSSRELSLLLWVRNLLDCIWKSLWPCRKGPLYYGIKVKCILLCGRNSVVKIMMKLKWLAYKRLLDNSSWLSLRPRPFLASGSSYWQLTEPGRRRVSFLQWSDIEYNHHTSRQAPYAVAVIVYYGFHSLLIH